MEKRHIQTFLTVSAAFFAINMPLRQAQASSVSAAVSRTMAKAGIGAAPAEKLAVSMAEAPSRRTAIAHASRTHATKVESASAKHDSALDEASVAPFSFL